MYVRCFFYLSEYVFIPSIIFICIYIPSSLSVFLYLRMCVLMYGINPCHEIYIDLIIRIESLSQRRATRVQMSGYLKDSASTPTSHRHDARQPSEQIKRFLDLMRTTARNWGALGALCLLLRVLRVRQDRDHQHGAWTPTRTASVGIAPRMECRDRDGKHFRPVCQLTLNPTRDVPSTLTP